jgi:hypothetical protein
MTQKDISLYYNVSVYIIFFPQKCHFQIISHFFLKIAGKKKHWLHYFKSFLSTPHSSYSFQNLPNVPTIYQKYFHINSSNFFIINLDVIVFIQWKANS